MKKTILILIFALFFLCSNSYGLSRTDLGTQITVNDGQVNSTWGGGSQALGTAGEDNETEGNPNTYTYQGWDLEGMFWNATTGNLFIIGGFNYLTGGPNGNTDVNMGDIFIGSDYVLDLSRTDDHAQLMASGGKYDLIKDYTNIINPTDISASTPYAYSSGGINEGNGTYSAYQISGDDWNNIDLFQPWQTYANAPITSYSDIHYALEINVSGIAANLIHEGNLIHATLRCGNDTIQGKADLIPNPEPATMFLLGIGLAGLAGFGRKRFLKKS